MLVMDDDEVLCESCGLALRAYGRVCWECKADNADLYADAAIQDAKEGR